MNITQAKKQIFNFLDSHNIRVYNEGKRKKICCLNPFHADKKPSALINENGSINCYGCGSVYDVFDVIQWLGYADGLRNASAYLGIVLDSDFKRESKPLFRGHVKRNDVVKLNLEKARVEYRIPVLMQRAVRAGIDNPVFECAWPFFDEEKMVNCVDYRVTDAENRKHVLTAWYDGNNVRITNPPYCVWGLDHIDYSKPCLIVEGCKCAGLAEERLGDFFSVHTWNRGSAAAKYVDWQPMIEFKDVYLLADRDRKKDKNGELLQKQIGIKTMEEIGNVLIEKSENVNVIIRETPAIVERIKEDGGDIVEMFELMNVDSVIDFIMRGIENE